MANLRLLLSHSTKQPHALPQNLIRSLSSSPAPIKPVSYPVKPKPPEQEQDQQETPSLSSRQSQPPPPPPPPSSWRRREDISRPWTREDARFVKDVPSIAPVSYLSRVAPLPEDRMEEEKNEEERQNAGDGELTREARMIESGGRVTNYWGIHEEENIPFPTIVKQEKRPRKLPIDLTKAIQDVKANAKRNFVETVEAHVNLGVDPRRGDQMVRGALTLPHGTGKTVRVAVFAEGAAADDAREAGADIVGGDELIEEIKKGGGSKLNFDKCITTPMFMPRLSKIGKVLGPRGLMPNPKLGSVTTDILGAVKSAKSARLDFRIDKTAIVHVGLGKVNFSEEALRENVGAFVNALLLAKPVGLKKTSKYVGYVKNFSLSSTMGPGFPVSIQSLSVAADNYNKLHGK